MENNASKQDSDPVRGLMLKGFQRKYLRSQAHHLSPVAWVGKGGISEALIASIEASLNAHELIKIKFNDHKDEKQELCAQITEKTNAGLAGIIGHVAILYRQNPDLEKRKVKFGND